MSLMLKSAVTVTSRVLVSASEGVSEPKAAGKRWEAIEAIEAIRPPGGSGGWLH